MAAKIVLALKTILEEGEYFPEAREVKQKLTELNDCIDEIGHDARTEAIEADAYRIIINAWKFFCDSGERNVRILTSDAEVVRQSVLEALSVLTPGYSNIVDNTTFIILMQAFDPSMPETTKIPALKLMRNVCIKSENNREMLSNEMSIIPRFMDVIKADDPSPELIRHWSGALTAFILNDDKDVAYNRSAERERKIFQADGVYYLSNFLIKYNEYEEILNSIVVAIRAMSVNSQFCEALYVAGVFAGLEQTLNSFSQNQRLVINVISCIGSLCVTPEVREKIGTTFLIKSIVETSHIFMENPEDMEIIVSTLVRMICEYPCGVAQFLSLQGVPFIIEVMTRHIESEPILKHCCLILQNIATLAGKTGTLNILKEGGRDILNDIGLKNEMLNTKYIKPLLLSMGIEERQITSDETPEMKLIPKRLDPQVRLRLSLE